MHIYYLFHYFLLLSGEVRQIGNDLAGSLSGVDVPKVAFLLDDLILQEGIVYAYSAFWRTDTPVRFQIWRLSCAEQGCKTFALVDEIRVIPSVTKQREDVSFCFELFNLFCNDFLGHW